MTKNLLSIMSILVLVNACKTADQEVEALIYKRQAPSRQAVNTYKNQYITKIKGVYNMLDGTSLTIDGSGSFKIGEVEYFIHEVLNDSQAVYVATTPDPNSTKKIYTYHGIITTGESLLSASYKAPDYSKKRQVTEKDTEFSWQINTFQPENINWKSGFSTVFALKESVSS